MSHIEVDLKVIETHAPAVARATEQPVTHIIGALNLLWHRAWVNKTAAISRTGLAGIFGPTQLDQVIDSLVDTGFLAPQADGWRVRGAEKYLRINEGRSKGGKAASGNLRRGNQPGPAGSQPGRVSRGPAGDQPGGKPGTSRDEVPGSAPALSPNTEHRTPLKEEPETLARSVPQLELVGDRPKGRPPRKPPDPEAEFARFTAQLTPDEGSVFEAYETHMGLRLGADWGLAKFIRQKLKTHHAPELCAAIRGHAADQWKREHSPSMRAILRDASVIAAAAKAGAA